METVTHIFQIIYYIAMSIAGPLAVIGDVHDCGLPCKSDLQKG